MRGKTRARAFYIPVIKIKLNSTKLTGTHRRRELRAGFPFFFWSGGERISPKILLYQCNRRTVGNCDRPLFLSFSIYAAIRARATK